MYFKLISKLADNFLQNAYPKFMEILPLLLSTVMLFSSPICDFQGEGYILDKENQSQVFVCSNGENYKEEIVIKVKTKINRKCSNNTSCSNSGNSNNNEYNK